MLARSGSATHHRRQREVGEDDCFMARDRPRRGRTGRRRDVGPGCAVRKRRRQGSVRDSSDPGCGRGDDRDRAADPRRAGLHHGRRTGPQLRRARLRSHEGQGTEQALVPRRLVVGHDDRPVHRRGAHLRAAGRLLGRHRRLRRRPRREQRRRLLDRADPLHRLAHVDRRAAPAALLVRRGSDLGVPGHSRADQPRWGAVADHRGRQPGPRLGRLGGRRPGVALQQRPGWHGVGSCRQPRRTARPCRTTTP